MTTTCRAAAAAPKRLRLKRMPSAALCCGFCCTARKTLVAGTLAFAAIGAIVANALFLQVGPHPSPMFGSVVTMPAPGSASSVSPLPRPRPAEADAVRSYSGRNRRAPNCQKLSRQGRWPRLQESAGAQGSTKCGEQADPLTNLVKATNAAPTATSSILRPPAAIPVSSRDDGMLSPGGSRRVAAVQRALTEYGYGQLKPTGTIGSDTQAAIVKFERERKIPATGQMNERLVRELSAMIGHPID